VIFTNTHFFFEPKAKRNTGMDTCMALELNAFLSETLFSLIESAPEKTRVECVFAREPAWVPAHDSLTASLYQIVAHALRSPDKASRDLRLSVSMDGEDAGKGVRIELAVRPHGENAGYAFRSDDVRRMRFALAEFGRDLRVHAAQTPGEDSRICFRLPTQMSAIA
jgi:hypothetical protein